MAQERIIGWEAMAAQPARPELEEQLRDVERRVQTNSLLLTHLNGGSRSGHVANAARDYSRTIGDAVAWAAVTPDMDERVNWYSASVEPG